MFIQKLKTMRSSLLTLLIVLIFIGSSCSQVPQETPGNATKVVVDSLGREVNVPVHTDRIVSFNSDLTEIAFALGAGSRLVSAGHRISLGQGQAWISDRHPDLTELTTPYTPQGGINVEELTALQPDLIISTLFGEVGYEEVLKACEPLGIPVVIVSFESLDVYMNDLQITAKALGVEKRGEELTTFLQSRLDFIMSSIQDIPIDERVRVYHGFWEIYRAVGSDIFEDDQIRAAGGVNVAESLTGFAPEISPEQIIAWNPEIIVALAEVPVDSVFSDPKLVDVDAVRNGRVYIHPELGWGFATPRSLFAIEWLAIKFYPERFLDVDIEARADEFYQMVYGFPYDGPSLQ